MLEKRENHLIFQKVSLQHLPALEITSLAKGSAGKPRVSRDTWSPSDSSFFAVLAPVTRVSAPDLGWSLFDVGLSDLMV